MKPLLHLFLLVLTVSCAAQEPLSLKDRELVFRSVNVIPMDREQVVKNRDVVIKGGRIAAITGAGKATYGKNAVVINASGKYLMPGLAEMHAHVPPTDDLQAMKDVVKLFALNGITTIRGMLGHPRHLELREKLQTGEILGPRLITSGPSFNGQSVKTPEAAVALVQAQKKAGYDFLKLHPGLTRETFDALATTAKKVNIPFAGHVSFDVGVWRAIDAGYATIDHLDGFVESLVAPEGQSEQTNGLFGMFLADKADTAKIAPLMQALRQKQVWVVPTQALAERWFAPDGGADALRNEPEMKYMSTATLTGWTNSKRNLLNNPNYQPDAVRRFIRLRRQLLSACNRYGVGLLLGSDAPQVFNVPGFSTHQELVYLVTAGLRPYEALRTGTVNVGTFLKREDIGVIRPGAVADLLLVSANPLEQIANTQKIEGVVVGNHWLSKETLANGLKSLEKQ